MKGGQWDLCMKKHRAVKILHLSAIFQPKYFKYEIMRFFNSYWPKKRKKKAELADILAIENVRLGTAK